MSLTEATERTAARTLLETWESNERMRHVPSLEWITQKLDADLRPRIDILAGACAAVASNEAHRPAVEEQLRALCKTIDRLADCARHSRMNHAPAPVGERLRWALNHAVTNLHSLDPNLFGRRYPMQTHERSKGEPIYGCLVAIICQMERTARALREVAPGLDEDLLAGL